MTDAALVGRLLDEYHERSVTPSSIRLAAGSVRETQVAYEVTLADGSVQVFRAFRADAPVPLHGRSAAAETVADWLLGRAATLAFLSEAGYRAPRPVRTRTGELVGVEGPWLSWGTTCVPGSAIRPDAGQLRLVGEALGRLHNVAVPPGTALALASRHPAVAVPLTLARLDAVAPDVPEQWQSMHATFRQTAERIRDGIGSVPATVVHGDVWARNVIQDSAFSVCFIDWETAGLGLAVVDFANCLVECHLDSSLPDDEPQAWLISPDEERIRAVAAGYASVRTLSEAELALLPDAAKFSAAVVGAIHLEAALSAGVSGPSMDARLERLRNRLIVADDIAAMAQAQLAAAGAATRD